jgi:hypothetical protein
MSKEIKTILKVSKLLCGIVDITGSNIWLSSVLMKMNYLMLIKIEWFIIMDSGKSGPRRSCLLGGETYA